QVLPSRVHDPHGGRRCARTEDRPRVLRLRGVATASPSPLRYLRGLWARKIGHRADVVGRTSASGWITSSKDAEVRNTMSGMNYEGYVGGRAGREVEMRAHVARQQHVRAARRARRARWAWRRRRLREGMRLPIRWLPHAPAQRRSMAR